uniref:Putative ovule protein n=1 Tax=Solanum chacoense TaxID=4108 RepID=A0A0V0GNP2_SOLCH
MDRTRRSILVFSVLIFLVCSSILVQAQTQKPNVKVAGPDPTKAHVESRPKQEAVEIYHENDDAGVDALNRDFYETQQFGTDFVAGH